MLWVYCNSTTHVFQPGVPIMSIIEETPTGSTDLNRRTALMALIGAVSLPASTALAQTAAAPMAAVSSPMQFRTTVLMTGGFAMQTSQAALERSRNPLVRQFAQLEINEQMALAAALGASPGSTPLRPDHAQMLQQLQSMTGRSFDRMYVQGQIMGHNEALALTSAYAQSGFDTQGRSVAILAVPSIQTHLTILSGLRA
jgi:putative membrane protein